MRTVFKTILRYFLARPSIGLARRWPSRFNISMMRKLNGTQLSSEQLKVISTTIKRKRPCKLLVFGLGNDSLFWSALNRGGVTIFLEDNEDWLETITKQSKGITAFLVHYNTQRKDWKMFLEHPSLLDMALPDDVEEQEWDVIVIDAPNGCGDQKPGRMKSIFLSSRLINNQGDIFVHDCEREVENVYCNHFLNKENIKLEIQSPNGYLRHYHMTHRSA